MIYDDNVIYIGQSKNMRNRILTHFSKNTYNHYIEQEQRNPIEANHVIAERYRVFQQYKDQINLICIPMPIEKLNETEEYYINKYQPKYNWAGVRTKYTGVKRQL